MKNVLIIGYVWPEPNSSAAGSRMMQLIKFFQWQGYHVTFSSPAQRTDHMIDLIKHEVTMVNIALNCSSFDDFISNLSPDIVLFDRFMMEEQFGWRVSENSPTAIRILDTEDLFCLRHARHDAFKQGRTLTDEDLLSSPMAKREIASIFRSDLSLMISHVEIDLLERLFKVDASLLHLIPFMLSDVELSRQTPVLEERNDFISIGNFRHPPNWDAVLYLKQTIWPLIRAELPKAKLFVCGAYPPPKATQLHDEKAGFIVKGWVDDALVAMESARVCLAPIRFGAGIKGKLSDAMICGTPSVTTEVGAESMCTENPWGGAIENDPQLFAKAAIDLYLDDASWQLSSDMGRKNANIMFEQQKHFASFALRLNQLKESLSSHRQHNFIGSMLNHHHHKSTKYMAQWITAKNELIESREK
jgi:glycosyltransferase involved in cell wall biosynthesis